MNHYIINSHTEKCNIERAKTKAQMKSHNKREREIAEYVYASCYELNHVDNFLFYHNSDFYLITYNNCHKFAYKNKYDYYCYLLKSVFEDIKSKEFQFYKIYKSKFLRDKLKDMRLRGADIGKNQEINYIYSCNANKEYCLYTENSLLDSLINQEELDLNYKKAKKYLLDNKYDEYLLDNLDELKTVNEIKDIDEFKIVRSIDHLSKKIKQKCHE